MSEPEKAEWTGQSGKRYAYWVYQIPVTLNAGQNGNYIYCKVVNGSWQPLYIGQGDLGARTDIDQHHQSDCLKRKGATHVHAHKTENERDRLSEEGDLLASYPQSYQPTGCNEKQGG